MSPMSACSSKRCAAMLKPGGMMVVSTLNRNWKSFALAIVGAEYVLRWLPRGTHQWDRFVTPDELAKHLLDNRLVVTEETGVVYSPFADKWSLSSDLDVNYMVVAEEMVLAVPANAGTHNPRAKSSWCSVPRHVLRLHPRQPPPWDPVHRDHKFPTETPRGAPHRAGRALPL